MNVVLFDSAAHRSLLPLTYARPVADLRVGILTIAEKWARRTQATTSFLATDYLRPAFPYTLGEDNLFVDGCLLPTLELLSVARSMKSGTIYTNDGRPLIFRLSRKAAERYIQSGQLPQDGRQQLPHLPLVHLTHPSDLFTLNDRFLREDFELLTAGRNSAALSPTNTVIGPPERIFLEAGVTLEACTINTNDGPVYFGEGALVLEGSLLRGPLAAGAGAVIKMGAKVYGGTTIGPRCKVGGEINNTIFQANSNKGHDGYIGNAVVGEWCNIGADTNASNLKNDYGPVKVWSYAERAVRQTGLQFHGLIMGDHGKAGINTMFNTGTVMGFSTNVFGAGFPPTFLPSFGWGGPQGLSTYRLEKAIETATRVMKRRGYTFGDNDRKLFTEIFRRSADYRSDWDS